MMVLILSIIGAGLLFALVAWGGNFTLMRAEKIRLTISFIDECKRLGMDDFDICMRIDSLRFIHKKTALKYLKKKNNQEELLYDPTKD